MKKMALSALTLLFAVSCGPSLHVDAEFLEYFHRFEQRGGYRIKNIHAGFEQLEGTTIGECRYEEPPVIAIDPDYWNKASDEKRESLIFHELGHCFLGLDHNDKVFGDGCAKSIMNSFEISDECYWLHREEYMVDLFGF